MNSRMDYAFISIAANVFISSYEPVVVSVDITTSIRVATPAFSIECLVALINAIRDYASIQTSDLKCTLIHQEARIFR